LRRIFDLEKLVKLIHRTVIPLSALLFALPASGHDTGTVHDHGIGYLLLLVALVAGAAALLRR